MTVQDRKAEMQKASVDNQRHPLTIACSRFLQATVENNDKMKRVPHEDLRSFQDDNPSSIRADIYMKRIVKYGGCSPSTLALGLLYVERLKRKLLKVWLTPKNFQRLYLVAVLQAVKSWEDYYYSNEHWAKIGGLTLKQINKLEVEFLHLMDWEMYVSTEEYEAFSASIQEWQPLPKSESVTADTKASIDINNVPRCVWDCTITTQFGDSQRSINSETSSPPTPSSSASARSEASTPRHAATPLGESPPACAPRTKSSTVRLWGQLFKVLS